MKQFILAFVVLFSIPVFAGKVNQISVLTQESVQDTLGFDEDVIKIEGFQFIQVAGADLAVLTNVRGYYSPDEAPVSYDCVTTFVKEADFYKVKSTQCTVLK